MYKLVNIEILPDEFVESNVIHRTTDNAFIPKNEANKDYQEYLEWLAEGNTPEPADN